jgi:hypothetical protein
MKSRILLMAAAVFALGIGVANADADSDARIAKLEETVRNLEARLASVEAQLHGTSAPVKAPKGKEGWRKLRLGMSEGDVEQLLGSPKKVDANQVYFTWWYDYPTVNVQFRTDSREVYAWHEPE